jgi:dTDP-glucose 4,6-dehydratase
MITRKILVTGGAGFIGSHLIKHFVRKYPGYHIYNLDKLTYAGNLENLKDIENESNYSFIRADIQDAEHINRLFDQYQFDYIIHLAAESHVDRSIINPNEFIYTNVIGTINLLNAARANWKTGEHLFYHVSTDEVYGSLSDDGFFTEQTPYSPHSPYSASKAGSDHFVMAWFHTFNLPVVISNCSNNYGPYQFPEKLLPLMINNIRNNKPLPVYGEGTNVRDWLWVEDHVSAIDLLFHKAKPGENYNIGGKNEWKNIDLIRLLCRIMDQKLARKSGESEKLITFVKDRAGHDQRYAIDPSKIENDFNWKPSINFETGLEKTVDWYLANEEWLNHVTSGAYQQYYELYYKNR